MNNKKARIISLSQFKDVVDTNSVTFQETKRKMRFAYVLADVLRAKGLSKSDFARLTGKSQSLISRWLSGTHNPTMDTITNIEHILGVNIWNRIGEVSSLQPGDGIIVITQSYHDTPARNYQYRKSDNTSDYQSCRYYS